MLTRSLRLTLAAAALAALGAPAAQLRAQQGDGTADATPRVRARTAREAALEAKIERLRRELESLAQREVDARRERSAAPSDSSLSGIQPQLERALLALRQAEVTLAAQRATAASAVREALAQRLAQQAPQLAPAAPTPAPEVEARGWIGVNLSSISTSSSSGEGTVVYHFGYPVVESVEPGSPARRAGLRAGDTIVAYDGRDVRKRPVPAASQLRPGRQLVVRVRRDGEVKDVPVKVERRPATFSRYYAVAPEVPAPPALPAPPTPLAPLPPTPEAAAISTKARPTRVRRATEATADPVIAETITPVAPPPPGTAVAPAPRTIFIASGWGSTVAGAQLVEINEGFRDTFGVASGVLVLNVAEGSPAASSGLRSGDVILRANDAAIATPRALQSVVRQCTTRSARLEVVRKKKAREVTLRW